MREAAFTITTAIDYPNGAPHVGHLYEKLISDVYARWYRYLGGNQGLGLYAASGEVYFLTGTDENGQKLQQAAGGGSRAEVQGYVDENVAQFQALCAQAELTHTDFIRTTAARHHATVQDMWQRLAAAGHIYAGEYTGLYCYSCEQFYPPAQAQLHQDEAAQQVPHCPVHHIPLVELAESGYFFKLSQHAAALKAHLAAHKNFIVPASAYDEIWSRLQHEDLHDLPISRINKGWGIEVPGDPTRVIYTWFDALWNYYTPVAQGQMPAAAWPVDMHVIGKDINWFHSVIWPALLMALDLELPKRILVHGMILDDQGRKMSKSVGNIVCPFALMAEFPLDTLRFMFIKTIASGRDGKISHDLVRGVHNGQLANELGNLVSRLLKLSLKKGYAVFAVELHTDPAGSAITHWQELRQRMVVQMEQCQHHEALDILWQEVARMNAQINHIKPWSLAEGSAELQTQLTMWMVDLYSLARVMTAFMPETSARIMRYLGLAASGIQLDAAEPAVLHLQLTAPEPLFVKR